jgi:hypothetical protein
MLKVRCWAYRTPEVKEAMIDRTTHKLSLVTPKRESYLTGITQGNILTVIQSTATNWLNYNSNRGQIEVYFIYTRNAQLLEHT